jgi:hypothetical protein
MPVGIYLSGRFSISAKKEAEWLKRTGCKHRCFSFATVDPKGVTYSKEVAAALAMAEKKKINIMFDSGAHSLHVLTRSSKTRGKKAAVKQSFDIDKLQRQMYKRYVHFCSMHKDRWSFFVTLDFKRDQKIIYKMQKQFLKDGLKPMPVVHGESDINYWIKKHADMGHKYIALGGASFHKGSIDFYFDKAFELAEKLGLEYHGLAFTSLKYIVGWPWKSVDSSTWSRCAAFGQLVFPDFKNLRFYNVHVSEKQCDVKTSYNTMSKYNKDKLTRYLKDHGFDIKAMRDGSKGEEERHNWNGWMYSNLIQLMKEHGTDWNTLADRFVKWEPLI